MIQKCLYIRTQKFSSIKDIRICFFKTTTLRTELVIYSMNDAERCLSGGLLYNVHEAGRFHYARIKYDSEMSLYPYPKVLQHKGYTYMLFENYHTPY